MQFLCPTMRLIDSIAYFSGCLASMIDFPTNWSTITMWFSMDADIVSSVSIIFDYHVSLNLADILHNFCVSYCSSSLVLHTFQSISHHWFFPYELDSHYHVVVHGCSTCFVSVHYFRLSCVPKSCQHSIQFMCLTMKLIDSIPYFSKYLASLIYLPTNWILITFWLSMDAVIVSSVSIIFDYHVSKILQTFYTIFVSHNEAHRYYYILFKVSRIIDLYRYELDSYYHVVVHGSSTCHVSVHYFRLSCVPKSC